MKLSRLYQPRNPVFWLMVVINVLSTLLAWVARSFDLAPLQATMVGVMAAANAIVGLYLTWRLLRNNETEDATKDSTERQ
jgi:membrane protein implicated in regulation of membrane protease activity